MVRPSKKSRKAMVSHRPFTGAFAGRKRTSRQAMCMRHSMLPSGGCVAPLEPVMQRIAQAAGQAL
jgi:hypothetical protein